MALRGTDGVVSHDSALEMLSLSDVIPNAVHVTLPRSRRNLPSMPGVQIHTSSRPVLAADRTVRDGIVLTNATRSILDSAEAGTAPEQIEMAVAQAVERGQLPRMPFGSEQRNGANALPPSLPTQSLS
jgi:predicted transcriptional regulator of viral defense system